MFEFYGPSRSDSHSPNKVHVCNESYHRLKIFFEGNLERKNTRKINLKVNLLEEATEKVPRVITSRRKSLDGDIRVPLYT